MASIEKDNVSYRLIDQLSNLVICSPCLQRGVVTPVPQLISSRHALTNECAECRDRHAARKPQAGKIAWLPGAAR